MRLGVVGLGLGYGFSKYLAHNGNNVIGVDIDKGAFENPRLDGSTAGWIQSHPSDVEFTTEFERLEDREIIFIFVSTPLEDGRLSIRNVLAALSYCWEINKKAEYAVMSTLPIGAMKTIHGHFPEMKVLYCPPMIKKADFIYTFIFPPSGWQLFGGEPSGKFLALFTGLQRHTSVLVVKESVAEAAKLCTNLMLATKVIVANAIGEWLPEDGKAVCAIVNQDPRVGQGYFTPGGPASGPCLPRDLQELEAVSEGSLQEIVKTLNTVNHTDELA
jgi:UDPglucose 6-dehydrogenase